MPSRGSARSAWTGRGTLKSSPAVRAGARLRVEPTRAPLKMGFTFSLIPAFSPRRRRNVRRLLENSCAGICRTIIRKIKDAPSDSFSPGEKARMRASVKTNFLSSSPIVRHPKLLLSSSAGPARRSLQTATPFSPGARMVPMPSRGSARSAWTGRGTLQSSPAVRAGAGLRVEPTRAPLKIGFTFSLIPAFSPRRRRNARRLLENSCAGIGRTIIRKIQDARSDSFSPGEKARMRASVKTNFRSSSFIVRSSQTAFVIAGWPRPAVFADGHPFSPGARMVPMPSRGSARSAWTGRGPLQSSPAVRAGAMLRVEPTRAPLKMGFTFSLIPAFSPRRRRNARRLLENSCAGICRTINRKIKDARSDSFSPGEKVRMRASVKSILKNGLNNLPHPGLLPKEKEKRAPAA